MFDGAFLTGGVGVGVVDGGAVDAFEGGWGEELASMAFRLRLRSVAVGGHGSDRAEGAFGDEAAEGTQVALGQDDDAVFEVVVDGALRGKARPTLEAERAQAGGDGEALSEEVDETLGEAVGHHGAAALGGVGLLGALLGQSGGILGINPAAMDFVTQQDAGEPSLRLTLQPTVRETVKPREGTHAQCLAPAF